MTEQLNMSHNQIHGVLPNLSSKIHLLTMDLSSNEFNGSLPLLPQNANNMFLSRNKFSGTSNNFCNFTRIVALDLSDNLFSTEISQDCFMILMCLSYLNLANNNFMGEIPSSVDFWKSMPELGVLSLKSNKLSGSLPSSLCHLAELQVMDISGNNISGTIPKCVKYFAMFNSKLKYDSQDNRLTGEIPAEVTSLVGLFGLNLSRNNLVGTIPRDIGSLELLNFLDLSKNNLSGSIPPTLSQLSHLGMLNLSFNNLSGRIPWDTHMQTFDVSTYMGNPGLCGPPLVLKPYLKDEMLKKPKSTNKVDEVHENKFITRGFYISMALGFIVAFWGVCGTLVLNKWCWITILKMFIRVEDWFYVNVLVNKNRIQRHFEKH
ncbi:Leucine-rich repeat (LRR) protein associated with apoptosis in muscle tissue [Handroanthus impetiginosus]|uniref:Leucine-rich repeat (LRR) protein associated with apoptosis in muscle tissue n=1 Tax=Handroanthus impetiginosus TaxID=429701 RepID=A0A2G9GZ34_9LAMI|nr:Leucine-rich repeat (LRR) protein associated with apoptosis in muscle tissue [Handroanthus impetiginosus]